MNENEKLIVIAAYEKIEIWEQDGRWLAGLKVGTIVSGLPDARAANKLPETVTVDTDEPLILAVDSSQRRVGIAAGRIMHSALMTKITWFYPEDRKPSGRDLSGDPDII